MIGQENERKRRRELRDGRLGEGKSTSKEGVGTNRWRNRKS